MLKRGEVYFASPGELNDAQECRPQYIFKGKKEVWQRFTHYLLIKICFDYDLYSVEESSKLIERYSALFNVIHPKVRNRNVDIYQLEEFILEDFNKIFDKESFLEIERSKIHISIKHFFRNKIITELEEPRYLASFSSIATNPTMWGHYANADTGFVIIYKSTDNKLYVESSLNNLNSVRKKDSGIFEIGLYNTEKLDLQKVEYLRRPTKINAFSRLIPKFIYTEEEDRYDVPLNLPSEITDYEENKFGLYKYSDWKYEKEIRAFFPTHEKISPQVRVLKIDAKQILGIIFGSKMSRSDKEKAIFDSFILRYGDRKGPKSDNPFYFFNANEKPDKFELNISPLGKLNGFYFGDNLPITRIDKLDKKSKEGILKLSKEINQ